MFIVICRLIALHTSVVELLIILFKVSFDVCKFLTVFCYVTFSVAYVTLDQKNFIVFFIIRNLLLNLMKKSERLN
jgi:hypothetical protein